MAAQGYVRLEFPEPGHRATPVRFTWYRFPDTVSYTLILLDAYGEPVREWADLVDNWFDPPEGWEAELPSPGIYFWQVVAVNGGGEPIAMSPLRDFVHAP